MAIQRLGIIMHGVTGRMGMNQHLIRSIVAIRNQGGVTLSNGDKVMPDPILIGRNAEKIEALARAHKIERWGTDLDRALELGGAFHRSRIRLLSSQVSTIAPDLGGRWTKERRMDLAWRMLGEVKGVERLITQRFPLGRATEAYGLIDRDPAAAVQVLFVYD